jgi:predicted nuclease with TOPRIM domain
MSVEESVEQPDKSGQEETPESLAEQDQSSGGNEPMGRLKTAWSNKSPKWFARAIPGKEQMVDQLVTLRLEEFQSILAALDKEDSELAHRIAELSAQLIQLSQRMVELEEKMADLESGKISRRVS